MSDLFQRIEDRRDDWNVDVIVTFLEIYNEEIRDLLTESGTRAPRGGLQIREDKSVKVVGLVELKPRTADEVKAIVLQGNTRRTQSPTHANETSSRSHAVLQIQVTQSPRTAALTEQRIMGTLSIIDLAGSERAAATTNMGQRMVEGANINKSLLALGNCINALCENGGSSRHVPYRNSKLTRLLKFSLGGNCKTVMIVCVAPTSNHFDDTHNTLIYAERATKIKTRVVTRNVVNVDRHVGRYVEAINRLNSEIQELKEKLSGKRNTEQDIQERKKREARAEVDRARKEVQAKTEQTQASIVDGANCSSKLSLAKLKLKAIEARLSEIDGDEDPAAQAEKGLLRALAAPEEDVLLPTSSLNTRLQRSSNSSAMFDATMRAVSERKSDRLDETSVEVIKLEASYRRATMEKLKAESERDALREGVSDLTEVVAKLVGMLGRCTMLVGEAATSLNSAAEKNEGSSSRVKGVAQTLESIKEKNDAMFKDLLGHTTESYRLQENNSSTIFDNFRQHYGASFGRRISSGPAVLQTDASRRTSLGNLSAITSPPRRMHKSPRKSLRSSLTQPYNRRLSDKDKKAGKTTKSVQWMDEAGQGDLDDRKENTAPPPKFSITPASPDLEPPAPKPPRVNSPLIRPPSALGSESDWEDEIEKTDVFSTSFVGPQSRSSLNASLSSLPTWNRRPSRFESGFLKGKGRASALGSLVEGDEESMTRKQPLSDMSMNHVADESTSNASTLNINSKSRDRLTLGSPRRAAAGKTSALSASTSRAPTARRRSNVGPVRVEKTRRRASMIPELATQPQEAPAKPVAARRVVIAASPVAKRVRRVSLTKSMTTGSLKMKNLGNLSLLLTDPNSSLDMGSSRGGSKPTWR